MVLLPPTFPPSLVGDLTPSQGVIDSLERIGSPVYVGRLLDLAHESLGGEGSEFPAWSDFARLVRVPHSASLAAEHPQSFWKLMSNLGFTDHALSHAVAHTSYRQTSWDGISSAPFPEVLWFLSLSHEGRELCAKVLQRSGAPDSRQLLSARVPLDVPLKGVLPLSHCLPLTPSLLANLPATMSEAELTLFWNSRCCPGDQTFLRLPSEGVFGKERFRVLTLNVWGVPGFTKRAAERFQQIGEELAQTGHDIVALQEMWDVRTQRILEVAQYPHHVASPDFPGLRGRGGIVILSKHPVMESHWHPFRNYGGVERTVEKGALLARIVLPSGREIVVVNTHLVSPPEKMSNLLLSDAGTKRLRRLQLGELATFIQQRTNPTDEVYILGDFNAPEESDEYRIACALLGDDILRARIPLSGGLESAPRSHKFYTFDPTLNRDATTFVASRLDYLFTRGVSKEVVALEATLFGANRRQVLSDHFGLSVTVELPMFTRRADFSQAEATRAMLA